MWEAAKTTTIFSQRKAFIYACLSSISHAKSTGIVKYYLIYDAVENEDEKCIPVASGFFEETIQLPFVVGYIACLWKCESTEKYLETTWLKESVLWSRALVTLIKKSPKNIYDNDHHMEGLIKMSSSNETGRWTTMS